MSTDQNNAHNQGQTQHIQPEMNHQVSTGFTTGDDSSTGQQPVTPQQPVQQAPVTPPQAPPVQPVQTQPVQPQNIPVQPPAQPVPAAPVPQTPVPPAPAMPNQAGSQMGGATPVTGQQPAGGGVPTPPPAQKKDDDEDKTPADYKLGQHIKSVAKVKLPAHELNFDETKFLSLLAGSISLSKDEKKRIIDSIPKLKQQQVDELIRIFEEERRKFAELSGKHVSQLEKLSKQHARDWEDIEMSYVAEDKKADEDAEAERIRKELGL